MSELEKMLDDFKHILKEEQDNLLKLRAPTFESCISSGRIEAYFNIVHRLERILE